MIAKKLTAVNFHTKPLAVHGQARQTRNATTEHVVAFCIRPMEKTMRHLIPAILILASLSACKPTPVDNKATAALNTPIEIDVVEIGVSDIQKKLASGKLTSQALTQAYLDRISKIDRAGPMLNSIIELNPNALNEAIALDTERKAGKIRGPMHGIPVLLKDNIDVVGMANTAGSLAMSDNFPNKDAFLVARLRAAGAILLGKTNLSEWANFRSTRSSSGWSSRGGQTKNPYVLDRNPCGSSSGTGTSIAASLATIGIGTETDGSIICPASVAGLVGLKPTVGLVSRVGIIPISISQDTAGPMGRSVTDVAILLNVIAGMDEHDPSGHAVAGNIPDDYTQSLKPDSLRGKRLGLLRQAMGYHPDVDKATEQAVTALKAAGAEVVDIQIATYGKWNDAEFEVLLYEFKDGLNRYLESSPAKNKSLEALIAWNNSSANKVMPYFSQEIFELAQKKGPLTDIAYLNAKKDVRRFAEQDGLLAALDGNKLDAIIAPSTSPAWPTDPILGDHFLGSGYGIAAVAGTPSITVPSGSSHGLPIGLVFMGPAYSEPELLGFAFAFEQATKARKPPEYKTGLAD